MIFFTIEATSLVSLVATLDPPRDLPCAPPRLFGWWNLWQDARAVCEGSPFSGCSLVFQGTDSSLLVLMIVFQVILRSVNIPLFKGCNGVLNTWFLLVILSLRIPSFLQRQEIFSNKDWRLFFMGFLWLSIIEFLTDGINLLTPKNMSTDIGVHSCSREKISTRLNRKFGQRVDDGCECGRWRDIIIRAPTIRSKMKMSEHNHKKLSLSQLISSEDKSDNHIEFVNILFFSPSFTIYKAVIYRNWARVITFGSDPGGFI